ncbi:Uncharacterised protein [Mycobacteroides abscessus subsp. abscessus]|nr:Uncharacterised protein [Mycobacteroides abscessus subsp. abscessus]
MDRKRRTPPRTNPSTIPLGVVTRTVGVFDPEAMGAKIAAFHRMTSLLHGK